VCLGGGECIFFVIKDDNRYLQIVLLAHRQGAINMPLDFMTIHMSVSLEKFFLITRK